MLRSFSAMAFLALVAGTAQAQVVVAASPLDSLGGNFGTAAARVYNGITGGYSGGNAIDANSFLFDDYSTVIASPKFVLTELRFVGGVDAANQGLEFDFFDQAGAFSNSFTVGLTNAGYFIYTINTSTLTNFQVPSKGFLSVNSVGGSTGGFFYTPNAPAIGTNNSAVGDSQLPAGSYYGFGLSGTAAVPEPGAVALLGGFAVGGASFLIRRRK